MGRGRRRRERGEGGDGGGRGCGGRHGRPWQGVSGEVWRQEEPWGRAGPTCRGWRRDSLYRGDGEEFLSQ
jgi:hypothetical protein